ncbi:hypothetical protein E4U57_007139 [Claviceps arundinis]|uniref:Uncharacterized protein n=1 Tax=Claviceps arundinis TaxID=1623583 RepID=A0ABQ7P4R0_9HYPO|nr:hypothetical protein E4U57_007139 [Claviceps arundinis]
MTMPDRKWAVCQNSKTFEGLVGDLRKGFNVDSATDLASHQSLIASDSMQSLTLESRPYVNMTPHQAVITAPPPQQHLPMPREHSGDNQAMFTDRRTSSRKRCFVCGNHGCWSTNHSYDEQKKAKEKWWKNKRLVGPPTDKRYDQFLQAYEGVPTPTELSDDDDGDDDVAHHAYQTVNSTAFTSFQPIESNLTYTNCFVATTLLDDAPASLHSAEVLLLHSLRDNAFSHALTGVDPCATSAPPAQTAPREKNIPNCFVSEERYSDEVFQVPRNLARHGCIRHFNRWRSSSKGAHEADDTFEG